MSNLVLTDAKIYVGGMDVSGYANEVVVNHNAELLNHSVFGFGTRRFKPGLFNLDGSVKGFTDYDDTTSALDLTFQQLIGADGAAMSVAPEGNAEGDTAYTFQKVHGSYKPISGTVGELAPFELDVHGNGGVPLVRGVVGGLGAKTATGNSTAPFNLGAVTSAQRIAASVHVVAASGTLPTLDVVIESGDAGFGTPTTRLTFTQLTAVGSQFLTALGPITDTYWRAKWTVGGTTPSFTVFIVLGICSK
jgi:hypothetical protein